MDGVALLQAGSALLLNACFAWLIGSWFARRWLWPARMASDATAQAIARADVLAAGLGAAGCAAALWAATAVMADAPLGEAAAMLWMMLSTTGYGHTGSAALLAMLVLLALRAARKPGRATDLVELAALAALLVFTVTRASMGHAGEGGLWTATMLAEAVHLFAVGVWSGAVFVAGWLVLSGSRGARPGLHTDRYLERMSQAALAAVAAIAATGVYSAWHRVGSAEHLLHTPYGWILQAKVLLVLLAVGLGGYNKFIGLPAAARSARGVLLVRRVLQVESLLLLGALLAAALLTSQQPPAAG